MAGERPMSIRAKGILLASLAGLPLAVGIALLFWGTWTSSGLSSSPGDIHGLIQARRFDEAERRLLLDLAREPDRPESHLLMAVSLLSRPRPRPDVALDHLRRIREVPALIPGVRLNEARAYYILDRFDKAEEVWLDGLRHDSARAESGSNLLGLYYLQGRSSDDAAACTPPARKRSATRVSKSSGSWSSSARTPSPWNQSRRSASSSRWSAKNPGDVRTAVALASYFARASRAEEGVALLRRVLDAHPEDHQAWLALLKALDDAARKAELKQTLVRLPAELVGDPWIDYYRGQVAEAERDWPSAVRLYRRARRSIRSTRSSAIDWDIS